MIRSPLGIVIPIPIHKSKDLYKAKKVNTYVSTYDYGKHKSYRLQCAECIPLL